MSNEPTLESRPAHRRGRPVMENSEKKRAATFRLSPKAFDLIAALVDDMGLSQAAVIETSVRDLAKKRGVKGETETAA